MSLEKCFDFKSFGIVLHLSDFRVRILRIHGRFHQITVPFRRADNILDISFNTDQFQGKPWLNKAVPVQFFLIGVLYAPAK